jgi:DNA polymerase III alpha subunit
VASHSRPIPYAELHAHTNFSFLDGASAPDDLVDRAVELGLTGLAATDHDGLYGAVRFTGAAEEAGLHPVVGVEVAFGDAAVADPDHVVVPARRARRRSRPPVDEPLLPAVEAGRPARPRPERARLPGHRDEVKEDLRGIGARARGPRLVLLARDQTGWRSLTRLLSRANLAGTKAVPRVRHALLDADHEAVIVLSGGRSGEIGRRLLVGDRAGARAAAERLAGIVGPDRFVVELSHHLRPDDDWLVGESVALARDLRLPVVVTNAVHYARPEDREMHDVLTAIKHGRTLDTLADLRRPDGESYLKSGDELAALGATFEPTVARAWREGIERAVAIAAECAVDLGFEQYRFPGFPVPDGETPFSYLSELCWTGARARYHPLTPAVVKRLAHELDVIERAGLAEFFLICWDLMRFAKERGIPAQGRGSATSSIVSYTLGISRVEPIAHDLLFERFINPGRTTYPDVDIDFSSARREEVIQYIYGRYGPEHTGMVCNLVTYRARSAVREVGYALGFPRPLVDRVAKALETYDSVMVRRDLEADGGFAEFFGAPSAAETAPVAIAAAQGLTDSMGQLDHARGGRIRTGGAGEAGDGRLPRPEDARRAAIEVVDDAATGHDLVDQMGRLDKRLRPLVGKVPPWNVPKPPEDPDAPRPFAWILEEADASMSPAVSVPAQDRGDGGPDVGSETRGPARDAAHLGPSGPRSPDPFGGTETGPGMGLDDRLAPRTPIRGGGTSDDEGGPGDTPASVAWLRAGRGTGYGVGSPQGRVEVDPEHGQPLPPPRKTDRLGRPSMWDPAPTPATTSSVARIEPEAPPQARGGSTIGLSHWERWLEFCARIDGFPRHLSIHSGGMLVTAAPLIDIAPIEKATMPDRVVVQFDKRDVETLKLIKLDLLGLGMLAAMDETLQLIQHDCAVCLDLDRLPEDVAEVFAMLGAADTVGVFQVESRAQMQTLPKSKPTKLDDLVVEVAIIRPGPIQGNAVHPFLRRRQGLEPVTYLHPSLEPVLKDSMGVILYQEQVMRIAIEVAGFSPAESDGFRRAMGTWRSSREMEKLHRRFVDGCLQQPGMTDEIAEELFRQVAAFASFGFAKSHAAAFARTAYESAFLKLFYPAQFLVGLINAQPMGFYPVEVLVNDTKRHGVAVLPVDLNASSYKTTTEWVGPDGQPPAVESSGCIVPSAESRERWTPATTAGWGVRLGLHLVKGIGEQHEALLDAERARGPYRSLVDVVERTDLPEEVLERLIRSGAMDSLGRPRRELLWQLREVAGASRGRMDGRTARALGRAAGKRGAAAGRPMDLRLPPTDVPALPPLTESERIGDAYAVLGVDAQRQVVGLFRPALDRLGAVTNAALADRKPGWVRVGGLVVTRQHPMTAKGTVFLALEDETGMVNVTMWPSVWERLRGVVRRHALLLVDGELQREASVVNLVARDIKPLPDVAASAGGPERPGGVRQMGHAGMRRLG